MPVQYNMNPFTALKIIYGDTTDGFAKNEFELNEKERGIVLPFLLKDFLLRYAYLPINRLSDSVRFFHPNLMTIMNFSAENIGNLSLLSVGRVGEYQVAVKNEAAENPRIYLVRLGTQNEMQVLPSDDTVSEILKVMLCGVLLKNDNAIIADDPQLAVRLMRENGVDFYRITNDPDLRREYSVCFSEETRTFTVGEFIDGKVTRFFFVSSEEFKTTP